MVATGVSVAAAQDGGGAAPAPSWTTTPQVPGSAHRLVSFGFEAAADGSQRAWALGEAGEATVLLTRAAGGAWATVAPRLEGLAAAGGQAPQHAAEMAADGHGALLAVPAGEASPADAVLFTRAPGGTFARAAAPGAALEDGERLAAGARVLLAVAPGDGGTFVAPTDGAGVGRAVLRHAGGAWSREPVDAPGRTLRPVGLAAGAAGELWLLARDGDGVVLLAREAAAGTPPRWAPVTVAANPLLDGADVAPPPADPLTATEGGLWIDVRLTVAGARRDATLHLATGAASLAVDGSWCDVEGLCDHDLGFVFADGERGYRSVATPAREALPYGRRFVSAPLDTDVPANAPRRAAQRQGGFAALTGERFVLADGIGEDGTSTTQAIALDAAGAGLTGGTHAFGDIAPAASPVPAPLRPQRVESTVVTGALSPSGDGRVVALTSFSGARLYRPEVGWSYTSLQLYAQSERGEPPLTARRIAWPRPGLLIGVGSGGLLVTVRGEPQAFTEERSPGERTLYEGLERTATLLDVACTRSDPLECLAVGRDGLVVRGDGERWSVERLPGAGARADATSVRYAGRAALIATSAGLYTSEPAGPWRREPQIPGGVRVVDALEDGGAVVDGRWARDGAGQPWRAVGTPLDRQVIALAAVRDGNRVRALAVTAVEAPPLPEPLPAEAPEPDPDAPPTTDPAPVDTVVLRETPDGWVDLDRAGYQRSGGRDLPATTANTRAVLVDDEGTGWLLGGADSIMGNGLPLVYMGGTARRLDGGVPAAPPGEAQQDDPIASEAAVGPGRVRLAIGGHPACLDRCSAAGGQGFTPDVHLRAAADRIRGLAAADAAPAALVVGGGRASVGGEPLDGPGARRYRELLAGFSVPTYVTPGPGDLRGGGAAAFAQAFGDWPAPVGTGQAPPGVGAGIDLQPQPPGAGAGARTRTAFAFDVRAAAGVVRVVVVDNAAGRLAGGPDGWQASWLDAVLTRAGTDGIPVVVVGSEPLDDAAGAQPASDADEMIRLLAGRASAYVATAGEDDPASPRFGGAISRSLTAPDGGPPLTLLQSATLGYSPSYASFDPRAAEEEAEFFLRTSSAALLLLDVEVTGRTPQSNVVPVHPLIEPLVDDLQFEAPDAVAVGRALFLFGYGFDVAQLRFLRPAADGTPEPASGPGLVLVPSDRCLFGFDGCDAMPTNATFESSNPAVGMFVATRRADPSQNGPLQVVLDARGNVVPDPRSPVFCPIGAGATTISIRVGGGTYSRELTVADGGPVTVGTGRPGETRPVPEGTCAFDFGTPPADEPEEAAEEPAPPAPAPVPVPVPSPVPAPEPPAPKSPSKPSSSPQPPAPVPAQQPPLPALTAPSPASPVVDAAPPAVSVAKPPAPPPAAPPPGVSVQQAPVTATQVHAQVQVQVQGAVQSAEQRRLREALEAEHAAAAYAPPGERAPWELIGLAAILLAAGGGSVAGRARAAHAPAYARASVRRR